METYEEVMRRNEPKNYTVKYRMADGTTNTAVHFTSFEEADIFRMSLETRDYIEDIQIFRSGRHPNAKAWSPTRRAVRTQARKTHAELEEITINEEVWALPAGYVDGDADKHGPVVVLKTDNRVPARCVAEKAEWARKNTFTNRMIGI